MAATVVGAAAWPAFLPPAIDAHAVWSNVTAAASSVVDTVGWPVLGSTAVLALVAIVVLDRLTRVGGEGSETVPGKQNLAIHFLKMCLEFRGRDLVAFVREHKELFAEAKRTGDHAAVTSHFYDLMGAFIAMYYGPCFHFAPPEQSGQTRADAILSLHHRIARMLNLSAGKHALDIGCSIGGMIHDITYFSGSSITGLTLSSEEVREGNAWLEREGLHHHCEIVQGDAQAMPFPDNEFDAAYAVYALKYFTQLDTVISHVQRTLKPGGLFLVYCILKTDTYDESNPLHRKIVGDFEYSCGMPSLHTRQTMVDACARAGLECVTRMDISREIPWYYEFDVPALHFFLTNPIALGMLSLLEKLWILPRGFRHWLEIFVTGNVMGIYRAGKMGILSGSDLLVFRKPVTTASRK